MFGPTFETFTFPGGALQERDVSLAELVHRIKLNRSMSGEGVSRPYRQVAAVYACVDAKAKAHAMLPLMVSTADDEIVETGPLAELADCPNPRMTASAFWMNTSANLDLFGRVHWVMTLDAGGRPVEVTPVSPLLMKAVVHQSTGELLGWKYRPHGGRGQELMLALDEVHTLVDPDFEEPLRPWEGMGPRRAAAMAIRQYYKADVANEASLDNGVEPGGAFKSASSLSDEQRQLLTASVHDRYAGAANRRRFLVLEGGLEWQQIGVSFTDMEFAELKAMSRTDICAAFSVPPAVVGFYDDSNYAHAESAERGFWIRTILPRATRFAEEWEIAIAHRFDGDRSLAVSDARRAPASFVQRACHGYRRSRKALRRSNRRFFVWFDSSDVPAVQRAKMEQAQAARDWIDKGVPLNDVIDAFDLPFPRQQWGGTWYKPIGLVDVNEDFVPGDGHEPGSETPPAQEQGATSLLRHVDNVQRVAADKQRARIHRLWLASWAGLERAAYGKLKAHFNTLRKATLDRLFKLLPKAEGRTFDEAERRDLIGQILFDLVEANGLLSSKVGPLIREAFALGGAQSMQEAADAQGQDKPAAFDLGAAGAAAKLRRRQVRITEVNRKLQKQLRETIAEAMSAGETTDQIAERVRHKFNLATSKARTIAMTETGGAVEEARQEGRKQAGVPLKSWLWSRKESGRPSHAATEGETMAAPIRNDDVFVIAGTGVTAPHPRGSGVAEHDINCGCTAISRYEGDSIKAVLDRYESRGFLTYEHFVARRGEGSK